MKKYLVTVAAAFAVMAAIGQARAQTYVYSVKYVCGLQTTPSTSFKPPARTARQARKLRHRNQHPQLPPEGDDAPQEGP